MLKKINSVVVYNYNQRANVDYTYPNSRDLYQYAPVTLYAFY